MDKKLIKAGDLVAKVREELNDRDFDDLDEALEKETMEAYNLLKAAHDLIEMARGHLV